MENCLYILMRNDLASMNAGKAMAQASHASNALVQRYGKDANVKSWQKSTKQGFGTVLVLSVSGEELTKSVNAALERELQADTIIDPTYPYKTTPELAKLIPKSVDTAPRIERSGEITLFREEVTCGYVFGTKEEVKEILGKFPLHP